MGASGQNRRGSGQSGGGDSCKKELGNLNWHKVNTYWLGGGSMAPTVRYRFAERRADSGWNWPSETDRNACQRSAARGSPFAEEPTDHSSDHATGDLRLATGLYRLRW